MNHLRIYRRLALAAVAALLVGLMPATALADGPTETFDIAFSASSVPTTSATAGDVLDVIVTAHSVAAPGEVDTAYSGEIVFTSGTDSHVVPPGDCHFGGVTGICSVSGLVFKTEGPQTLTATETGDGSNPENTSTSDPVDVAHAAATSLTLDPTDPSVTTDQTQAYTSIGHDAYGNDWNATGSMTLTIVGTGTSCEDGTHTCKSTTVGGPFEVTGHEGSATGTASLTVTHGALHHLVLSPATKTVATNHTQAYTAIGYDAHGNSLGDVTDVMHLTIVGTGTSCEDLTHTCNSTTAGGPFTVTGHDGSATGTASLTVINFGPATHLTVIVTPPTTVAAGTMQSYTVTAKDADEITVLDYVGTVHLTSTDGAAVLPADSTLTADTGAKVFSVTLETEGTQSVTATDTVTGSITGTSDAIIVTRVSSTFHPMTPFRMLDTRTGNGLVGGKATLKPFTPVGIPIRNRGLLNSTVAGNAIAITANITVVFPSARSYLYIGPVGIAHPSTFTIAFNKGDITAYGATIAVGGDGKVYATYMATSGATDLLIDVTGYFTPDYAGEVYHTITPVRLVDTRKKLGISSKLVSKAPREFTVRRLGIPSTAKAVTGNLTVTGSTGAYALYLGPLRQVAPTTSTMNFAKGQTRANSLTVALSSTGTLWVTYLGGNRQTTDVVFDVTGYYTAYTAGAGGDMYVPNTPETLLDTAASPVNGLAGAFHAATPRNFKITNRGGVPLNATGITGVVSVNGQTSNWALFVGPADVSAPSTSALNFVKTDNCSNGVTVALNSTVPLAGTLSITYSGPAGATTNVVLFVTGYFVPAP